MSDVLGDIPVWLERMQGTLLGRLMLINWEKPRDQFAGENGKPLSREDTLVLALSIAAVQNMNMVDHLANVFQSKSLGERVGQQLAP